jgi:Cu+-exporting ATPase
MAMDPVCYTDVDEETAKDTASYDGREFYFCTASCRKKFLENPGKYAMLATKFSIDPQMSC